VTIYAGTADCSEESCEFVPRKWHQLFFDYYALSKGDNIQAYSIYSVCHYKVEIDNIFLKQFIAPVKKPFKNQRVQVCMSYAG
jgi:hypothetical protein